MHAVLQISPRVRINRTRNTTAPLLRGLIFDSDGRAMSPSHSRGRGGQMYRYYVSQAVLKGGTTERPAIAVAADAMAELAGTYALAATFKITVRVREGRLFAQATGQGEFELFAAEGRRWFARVTPLEVQFEGERGAAPAFVLVQSGQRLRFVRE